jgi:2-dehydropantoate 2-reductase
MRILVVGAGALGGYFGGRLLEAGRDVTFLVRERRAAQLAKTGLVICSKLGDASLPNPPTVMADALREPYDLILLGCKAYDLAAAADSFAPAVGPDTAILPFLNGMAHLDFLATRFGARAVLGGQCLISATLDAEGRVLHLNESHLLSFGEQDGSQSPRAKAIAATLVEARFESRLSPDILQEMWEKWAFIAAAAGICSLMRAPFGDITAAGAAHYTTGIFDECCAIAAANDIERGAPTEADHIVGDLLRRGGKETTDFPLLRIAQAHLQIYEARRKREAAKA